MWQRVGRARQGALVDSGLRIVESCERIRWCSCAAGGVALTLEIDGPALAMQPLHLIRILSVDDHPLLRSGIGALIGTQPDMQLVGEAANGKEAVQLHRHLNPDVTLMDLQMPDMSGLDAIIAIRTERPSSRIIVLTTYSGDVLAQRALKAGAQAYVLKSLVRTEILNTIRIVCGGEKRVQADVATEMAKHSADAALTARELEVLCLVASGYANKTISVHLDINEETTKTHVKSILAKLQARDRTHAVSLGLKRGIISL
jgi:DNA-binding NarL/FixJ family response regulator